MLLGFYAVVVVENTIFFSYLMRGEVVAMERRTMMADDSSARSMCDERDERKKIREREKK